MSTFAFFKWMDATPIGAAIRESTYIFPVVEVIHLLGLVALLGSITVIDMRLLGVGLRRVSAARVSTELAPVTLIGLILMLVTGTLLFMAEAIKCYNNDAFWVKMEFLASAIIFYFTVHRKVSRSETVSPLALKVTACLSLFLWFGVGMAGRAIAFI